MVATAQNYGSHSKGAFGKSGVIDWIVQRKSAVVLAVYFIYLAIFLITNNPLTFEKWIIFFSPLYFKIFTLVFLYCLVAHAWVGVWIIATDYLQNLKVRGLFLFICKLCLIGYWFWGAIILFQ